VCCVLLSVAMGASGGAEDTSEQMIDMSAENATATSAAVSCLGGVAAFASLASGHGSVWVRNETTATFHRSTDIPAGAVSVSCDGRAVYGGNATASSLYTSSGGGYRLAQTWPHPADLVSAACSRRAVAFADSGQGKLFFYAPPGAGGGSTALRRVFSGFRNASSLSLSCDGSLLAVGVRETGTVTVLRTSDGSEFVQLRDEPDTGFGASVALAGPQRAPVLAVGCPALSTVRVYECGTDGTCGGLDYVEQPGVPDFGSSVSMNGNAALLVAAGRRDAFTLRWDVNKRRYMIARETSKLRALAVVSTRKGNAFALAGQVDEHGAAFVMHTDTFAVNCPEC